LIKIIFAFFLIAILLSGTIAPVSFAQAPGLDKIRVVAHDGIELDKAKANGCKIVRDAGPLKGVICNPKVAESLGLKKDIRLFAVDVDANSQIGADLVQLTNNGEGTKIAIFDTGYNYNHVQLSSSYLGGYDFVNNDSDPLDDEGHGSHVAGIITSDGGRSIGVAPAAGVYSYKVLDENGSGFFTDTLAAFTLIVNGTDGEANTGDEIDFDAVSLSLGSGKPNVWKGSCDTVWPEMTSAIQQARDKGISVVIAAGNDGKAGVSFPGCVSDAITVAAVDNRDKVARFSGVGTAVDIAAPGVSIYSTFLGNNGHAIASGTSMATPMITGTIALMKSANNGLSVNDIESALFGTATDLGDSGKDSKYGHGRVNANLAVAYSPGQVNNPPTVTISSPSDGANPASDSTITFTATAHDVEDDDDTITNTISWTSSKDGVIGTGGSFSTTLNDGEHTITAEVTDSGGKTSGNSIVITVGTPPVTGDTVGVDSITHTTSGGKNNDRHLVVSVHGSDDSGNDVSGASVSIKLVNGGNSWTATGTTGSTGYASFTLKNSPSGTYTVTITGISASGLEWNGDSFETIFTK